jgi:hypothetical protein
MARNRLKTKLWCSSRQYRSDLTYCPEELRRLRCRLTDDIAPKRSELELPGWKVHWVRGAQPTSRAVGHGFSMSSSLAFT